MKKNISPVYRYTLLTLIFIFLFCLGLGLNKAWYLTPEKHFHIAQQLLNQEQYNQAIPHLVIATKSNRIFIKASSAYNLAQILHHGTQGVALNVPRAARYYEIAAENGIAQAQYILALLYNAGDKIPEDRARAISLMEQAAKTLPDAQYVLAVWTEQGYYGDIDLERAVELYTQAANAGHQNAMKSLINIYHGGFDRFPANIQKEQFWRHQLELNQKKNNVLP